MEVLPARTRVLHVGLVKTGTTSLQTAASSRRGLLLRHGVRYPGKRYNHRQAAMALSRRTGQHQATPDEWDELMAEVNQDHQRRILISNEFIAGWDTAVARRFVEELGTTRTHIVFTVRSFASLLPSLWQQYVKTGYPHDLEHFLSRVLADRPNPAELPPNFDRNDQGLVVSRWADIVGPENVTVIVVDKTEPKRISTSFEAMLGLPPGTLSTGEQGGSAVNRSLSNEEASLLLSVNQLLEPYRVAEEDLIRVLRRGATGRMLEERPPATRQTQLTLPPWAAEPAAARGREHAHVIATSHVRVIGNLDELGHHPGTTDGGWIMPDMVSTELAAQAVVGALSAGLHRGTNFSLPARARPRSPAPTTAKLVSRVRRLHAAVRRQLNPSASP